MRNAAVLSMVLVFGLGPPGRADDVEAGIRAMLSVGKEGAGNESAAAGWKAVVGGGAKSLLPTLKAFAGATPSARNWLRTAVVGIAEAEKAAGRPLPADAILAFVNDHSNDPAARATAFDVFRSARPDAANALLDGMADDPSVEIRRQAVARKLGPARTDPAALKALFARARDFDQVDEIAKLLEQKGEAVDLNSHFGYVGTWYVCGPFDSTDGAGYAKAFPAESGYEAGKSYAGKADKAFGWKLVAGIPKAPPADPKLPPQFSLVDLNKELGKSMDAVGYAATRFTIAKETPCEIRAGSQNAVQIFLNGKKVLEREAYHHGFYPDQHVASGTLKAGENEIVVKVAQNNMKETWAQAWSFNLRVCDATGGKLPIVSTMPPAPVPANKEEKK